MGFGVTVKVDWIKFCISVGFENVKVGFVFRVINTLFELMLVFPNWYKEVELDVVAAVEELEELVPSLILFWIGEVVAVDVLTVDDPVWMLIKDLHTEGCPVQV